MYFVSLNLGGQVLEGKQMVSLPKGEITTIHKCIPSFCNIFKRNLAQIQIILVSK